jgi:hypothetical protein
MGLKPERGEIFDYFLEGGMTGLRRAFHKPHVWSMLPRRFCTRPALAHGREMAGSRGRTSVV